VQRGYRQPVPKDFFSVRGRDGYREVRSELVLIRLVVHKRALPVWIKDRGRRAEVEQLDVEHWNAAWNGRVSAENVPA
jgi:hypothetical protein